MYLVAFPNLTPVASHFCLISSPSSLHFLMALRLHCPSPQLTQSTVSFGKDRHSTLPSIERSPFCIHLNSHLNRDLPDFFIFSAFFSFSLSSSLILSLFSFAFAFKYKAFLSLAQRCSLGLNEMGQYPKWFTSQGSVVTPCLPRLLLYSCPRPI